MLNQDMKNVLRKKKTNGNNVYNSLLLIFLSENPRAELKPVFI